MTPSAQIVASSTPAKSKRPGPIAVWRSGIIGVIAFLTLVDLFAAQAILPSLARVYGVSPSAIGFAVNASTIGMAVSCLGVALVSRYLNRRLGIWLSLALLRGAGWAELLPSIGALALFDLVLAPGSLLAFRWATRYALRAGTLGQY